MEHIRTRTKRVTKKGVVGIQKYDIRKENETYYVFFSSKSQNSHHYSDEEIVGEYDSLDGAQSYLKEHMGAFDSKPLSYKVGFSVINLIISLMAGFFLYRFSEDLLSNMGIAADTAQLAGIITGVVATFISLLIINRIISRLS
ncbi:hypothetical protein KP77_12480 [Jeotgalibacillus alimentarius]|uniref:Uncharacterized protein n=1 Tax=Jeotgalibacillus alimentarius TaxID=135826 RepID=A0A0C2W575_9BACL|nr:hypothetical protein [Jeotgalibacillus alimentarius]KIL51736.1 hypothetical protein KP77_12480 [Jeotgalibacillus alimentarius]